MLTGEREKPPSQRKVLKPSAIREDEEETDDGSMREAALACLVNLAIDDAESSRYVIAHGLDPVMRAAERGSELALDLLQIVGPYKYVLCTACGERNEGGRRCVKCGRKIAFEAVVGKRV